MCHPQNPFLSANSSSAPLNFLYTLHPISAHLRSRPESWLAEVRQPATTAADVLTEEGPLELPLSTPSIFATSEDPTTLQVATSVCLPGPSLSSFSVHSAAVQSGPKSWSSGAKKKSLKEEAIESLKAIAPTPVKSKGPPSPVQTLLASLSAGVIALILYKFTITIEDSLNRQTLSDNFSACF